VSVDQWDSFEKSVSTAKDFEAKGDVLEMIADIRLKTRKSQKVPNYLIDAMRSNLKDQPELLKQFETALEVNRK
jgi:hypothetical protein